MGPWRLTDCGGLPHRCGRLLRFQGKDDSWGRRGGGAAGVSGNHSSALGGTGGRGGLGKGGGGGDAEVVGENSSAVGGKGGDAAQQRPSN